MALKKSLMGLGLPAALASAIAGAGTQGLVATGSTSADALLIGSHLDAFATVAASTGAILTSAASAGDWGYVYNGGASTLTIYPPAGATIDNTTSQTLVTKKGLFWFLSTDTTVLTHKST